MIKIDGVEDCLDVVLGEAGVQPGHHVSEAVVGEVAVAFLVVGLEGALQRYLLVAEHPMQPLEALLGLLCQNIAHLGLTLFHAQSVGFLEPAAAHPFSGYVVPVQLFFDLREGDGAAGVFVDFVEEIADLFFGKVRVDVV